MANELCLIGQWSVHTLVYMHVENVVFIQLGFIQDFKLGGGAVTRGCLKHKSLGESGGMPPPTPRKFNLHLRTVTADTSNLAQLIIR